MNVSAMVERSSLRNYSPLYLLHSTLKIESSIIDFSDATMMEEIRTPITLESSNMTTWNVMVSATTLSNNSSQWFVNCVNNGDNSSWVSGDLLGWAISPQCQTRYKPEMITGSINFSLLMVGRKQLIELVLSEKNAGVNVTLSASFSLVVPHSLEFPEGSSPQPPMLGMYLARAECIEEFTPGSNFINSTSSDIANGSLSVLNIWFDGPSPPFLEPNADGVTPYCLIITSSISIEAITTTIDFDVQFINRTLTNSTLLITPKYAIYSDVFAANYEFYDQWGSPFINPDPEHLYCENGTAICGTTHPRTSSGKVLLSLNETLQLSWKLFTSVTAALSTPNSQPAKAYGMLNCRSDFLVLRLTATPNPIEFR